MADKIFAGLYCELVKTNTLTGSRFSADFHGLSTKTIFKHDNLKTWNQFEIIAGKNNESFGMGLRMKI